MRGPIRVCVVNYLIWPTLLYGRRGMPALTTPSAPASENSSEGGTPVRWRFATVSVVQLGQLSLAEVLVVDATPVSRLNPRDGVLR